ncbi:MAG: crossover junction endodeoxyribonuclease RuvC [Patescibacteria group bacterium]|nr:crossover junction endodeoxyribonuclease RuvC [Patescibacteria group bacterium]
MIILGIDPGTATTGYGIIQKNGQEIKIIDYGCILTPANLPLPDRLLIISKDLRRIIKKFKPDQVAVEELFFAANSKTAIAVGHARGVLLLESKRSNLATFEYTPLEVKVALTGYGRADKNQVQQMVKCLLSLSKIPKPDDAADALAVAICHANTFDDSRIN